MDMSEFEYMIFCISLKGFGDESKWIWR